MDFVSFSRRRRPPGKSAQSGSIGWRIGQKTRWRLDEKTGEAGSEDQEVAVVRSQRRV